MRKIKTTRYDVAEHMRTPEEMAAYLDACSDESKGDVAFIAKAMGDIERAKGKGQVAQLKEDFNDTAVAASRASEPRESMKAVKRRLKKFNASC